MMTEREIWEEFWESVSSFLRSFCNDLIVGTVGITYALDHYSNDSFPLRGNVWFVPALAMGKPEPGADEILVISIDAHNEDGEIALRSDIDPQRKGSLIEGPETRFADDLSITARRAKLVDWRRQFEAFLVVHRDRIASELGRARAN